MKKLLFLLLALTFTSIHASTITPTIIPIQSPKVGQAPEVNRFAASPTPIYRISWRTITVNSLPVNYLTSFAYSGSQFFTADNVFAATTYAEIQAKAAALGITNLPADPNAGH